MTSSPDDKSGMSKRRPSIARTSPALKGKGRGMKSESGYESAVTGIVDSPTSIDIEEQPLQIVRTDDLEPFVHHEPAAKIQKLSTIPDKPSLKPQTLDLISDTAVKVSATDLDQIFDSDDGEEDGQNSEITHFPFVTTTDTGRPREDKMVPSPSNSLTKLAPSDSGITLSDLSRIYPTPPSVEAMEEKFEEGRNMGDERGEHATTTSSAWETSITCLNEELVCIPAEYAPVSHLTSSNFTLPKYCVYMRSSQKTGSRSERGSSSVESSRTACSSKSDVSYSGKGTQ